MPESERRRLCARALTDVSGPQPAKRQTKVHDCRHPGYAQRVPLPIARATIDFGPDKHRLQNRPGRSFGQGKQKGQLLKAASTAPVIRDDVGLTIDPQVPSTSPPGPIRTLLKFQRGTNPCSAAIH